ncbi:hypothetical protein ULG90_15735 [Halopseudomonas pachastrellae]|nr:hypothetical protein ULG90_15735 [Halopseudomonas pachastrellae]
MPDQPIRVGGLFSDTGVTSAIERSMPPAPLCSPSSRSMPPAASMADPLSWYCAIPTRHPTCMHAIWSH